MPFIYSVDETLDVGEDRGTPILEDYADRMPFKYNGRIDEVEIFFEGGNAAAEIPDIDGECRGSFAGQTTRGLTVSTVSTGNVAAEPWVSEARS